MVVFEGYTKTNKHVVIKLINNHLYVFYTGSGVVRLLNDEYYTEDIDISYMRLMLLNAGFRT